MSPEAIQGILQKMQCKVVEQATGLSEETAHFASSVQKRKLPLEIE